MRWIAAWASFETTEREAIYLALMGIMDAMGRATQSAVRSR